MAYLFTLVAALVLEAFSLQPSIFKLLLRRVITLMMSLFVILILTDFTFVLPLFPISVIYKLFLMVRAYLVVLKAGRHAILLISVATWILMLCIAL